MSTYTPIASVTLSSAQSSVTFSGIPQTYTDLVVVASVGLASGGNFRCQVGNGSIDTSTIYSRTTLYGRRNGANTADEYGSSRSSAEDSAQIVQTTDLYPSSVGYSPILVNFMNYSNTTTYKTILARHSSSGVAAYRGVEASVSLWRSTSAINQIKFYSDNGGNISAGSTINLYGVANASITNVAKATGGDSVYTDGTYWYHIFRSSGTFTPTQALTADYLVVAGGGAGGGGTQGTGGGGGAGGMRCTVTATGGGGSVESALSLTAQAYTVTVGAGAAWTNNGRNNGSNSVFSTITSTGGGGGGSRTAGVRTGDNGGSGGGGSGNGSGDAGGTGTTNQGYAGGAGAATNNEGGGGGGAGAVGTQSSVSRQGGNGGNGTATSITGSSVTYAGGGGGGSNDFGGTGTGGTGGTGGGGAGGGTSTSSNGVAGTANTGSGGGGSGNQGGSSAGGAGGSGIVIVRYSAA